MELYLVRHGETILNLEKKYYGCTDCDLTRQGREQAEKLGCYFRNLHFDKVITSPLVRAVNTALRLTKQSLLLDDRLKEQNFGIFENTTYEELTVKYPKELDAWTSDYEKYCIPEGESFSQVRDRVNRFAEELWSMDGKILLVAHKGTLCHLLASLLKMPPEGYWNFDIGQGCYSKIDLQDGYAIIRCLNTIPDMGKE